MTLNVVYLHSDTYLACLNHALSTEKEEIMGLLLGYVFHETSHTDGGQPPKNCCIESIVILQRSDKKADRCEISPEELIDATKQAEMLSSELGRTIRVLGWYHSHPHITVQPSHIDLQTQMDYQRMDSDFIGLIFSVFQQQNSVSFGNVSMICFQTEEIGGHLKIKGIKIEIVPQRAVNNYCLKALSEIPQALWEEERQAYQNSALKEPNIIREIHNKAVFFQKLCQLVECCEIPCVTALDVYEKSLQSKLQELQLKKSELEKNIKL